MRFPKKYGLIQVLLTTNDPFRRLYKGLISWGLWHWGIPLDSHERRYLTSCNAISKKHSRNPVRSFCICCGIFCWSFLWVFNSWTSRELSTLGKRNINSKMLSRRVHQIDPSFRKCRIIFLQRNWLRTRSLHPPTFLIFEGTGAGFWKKLSNPKAFEIFCRVLSFPVRFSDQERHTHTQRGVLRSCFWNC